MLARSVYLLIQQRKTAGVSALWSPLPGPQTDALSSEADELFFGGGAGGGKTDLIIGASLTNHTRSIIWRREYPQLRGIRDRIDELLQGYGRFNGKDQRYKFDNAKRLLELGSVPHEADKERFQGRPHDLKCVARGTLVHMADGSLKAIENLVIGDRVMTLEGSRRVTRLIPQRRDAAVRVTAYDAMGHAVASQVQSQTHSLLTSSGWANFLSVLALGLSGLCTESRADRTSLPDGRSSNCPFQESVRSPYGQNSDQSPLVEFVLPSRSPYPLRLADVGQPIPSCFVDDGRGKIPTHTHPVDTYVHPYTKDRRPVVLDTLVSDYRFDFYGACDLFDIEVEDANHYITTGGFVNKNCFDELTHFSRSQYKFLIGWNRSANPNQRSRVIATGNPPTSAEGFWVIEYWAPWLDRNHPNPAKPGELRWFATLEGKDVEVAGPDPIIIPGEVDPVKPRSRTFVRALVQDNPYYMASGYMSVLQGLPEPLRSQMLLGDFGAGHEDHSMQVIPTAWVIQAQGRWTNQPPGPIDSMGVDVARGGSNKSVFTARHGWWFGQQIVLPGASTPDGWAVVQQIIQSTPTGAVPDINIDIVGVGSSVYDLALAQQLNAVAMDARVTSYARARGGQLGFYNKRAEWWWRLREALDPLLGEDLALPPDQELLADLTAPRWEPTTRGILIESKDDISERIMRSPDKGDSLVMAYATNPPTKRAVML